MTEEWKKRTREYRVCWNDAPERIAIAEQLLHKKDSTKQYSQIVKDVVTVYVTAPLLCEYVSWVVWQAVLAGKKRLYFLARDGYYLKQAAELFCEAWNLDMECKYLYGSRYIWRGAVYHKNREEALDYITLGGLEATFSKMMQRAGLSDKEAGIVAQQLGYDIASRTRLSRKEREQLRQDLSNCKIFLEWMEQYSLEKYNNTIPYLMQEGLMDSVPYALVDSGWTGSLQKSLTELLRSVGCTTILEGYYFGMYHAPKEKEAGKYNTYYFSPGTFIRRKVFFNNNLFEAIYSAPHGMTVGYQKQVTEENNESLVWIPILEQKENPNKERLLAAEPLLLEYIKEYAKQNGSTKKTTKEWKQQMKEQKRMEKLLRLFMGRPTKEEAQEYGSFVFCDDVIGEEKQFLAGTLTKEELKNGFLFGKLRNRFFRPSGKGNRTGKESAWPEGSVALVMGKRGFWHCALCEYVRLTLETWKNRMQGRKKNE